MEQIKEYYLYLLYSNEHHVYVGITKQPNIRKRQHFTEAKSPIKSLLARGFIFEFEILKSGLTESEAMDLERETIAKYKEEYLVLNKCTGGQHGGPGRSGENSALSKLTDKQITEIRNIYATEDISQKDLAVKYNVSLTTINNIITGKRSPHLGGPIFTNNLDRCHKHRKLSEEDVVAIRQKYSTTGKIVFKTEALKYGITGQHLSRILRGVDLSHLSGPILGKDYKW